MQEIDSTECSCNNWPQLFILNVDLATAADMREDVSLAHLDQAELGIVRMGRVVWRFVRGVLIKAF